MSYAQLLNDLPTDRLRDIVRNRASTLEGIPRTSSKRQLTDFLSKALATPASVSEAIDRTDLLQLETLVYVIAQGGEVAFDEMVREAGLEARGRLDQAVEGLASLGLAFDVVRHNRAVLVPGEVRQYVALPLPLQLRVGRMLAHYDVSVLCRIAENVGLPVGPAPRKDELAGRLGQELRDRDRVMARVAALPADGKRILQHVIEHDGVANLRDVSAMLDARQRNQVFTYDWSWRWAQGKPRNAIELLLGQGLLALESASGWGFGRVAVPGDVLHMLSGRSYFGEGAQGIPDWETIAAPANGDASGAAVCRDVAYFMGYLGRVDAQRTGKGTIHRATLKAIAKGLTVPTPAYAGFVYALCREAELISAHERTGLYDVTAQGLSWLDQSPEVQRRSLLDVWRAQTTWAEPLGEPLNDTLTYHDVGVVRLYRDGMLQLLAELARERPGEMASLHSLAARAHYRWWRRFPAPHDTAEGEPAVDPQAIPPAMVLVRRIAAESLHWLGLVDVAPSTGAATHVRLSALGRHLVLDEPVPEAGPEPVDSFVVQPNMEIYAPPNLSARLLYRLFRSTEPGGNGMLALSRESLRRSLDRGESAKGFLQFLRQHSSSGVPQNVEYTIQDLGTKHGHIKIGQAGLYMQVSDPMLLKELKAQKRLGIHFREQLADTVALITGDSVEAVLKELRQAGYLPVNAQERTEHGPAAAGRSRRQWKPSAATRASRADVDVRIDWDAVAAQDRAPAQAAPQTPPRAAGDAKRNGVVTDPLEIRALLQRASREGLVVEIVYQPYAYQTVAPRIVEPLAFEDGALRAHCRKLGDERLFNMAHIKSASVVEDR